MKTYIIWGLLAVFLIYLLIWSFNLHLFTRRQKKVKRVQELRAKGNEIKKRTIDCTKDYWYNLREVEDCKEGENAEKFYHYFVGVEQGVHELLLEMYDCGIVRIDALEEIAYGNSHLNNVDLSFLEELESEMRAEENGEEIDEPSGITAGEEEADSEEFGGIIQVEGIMADFFGSGQDVMDAARNLKEDDPGITDIHGTLSEGVVDVLYAVDAEREAEEEMDEPILKKPERSVEKDRKAREMTANAEIRNKIYEKWVSYVFELYERININANEDTKHKIRKALTDYGYNDVDVLLVGPDYDM